MKNKNILEVAFKVKEQYYPDAPVILAAGSVFRGEGNEFSDIDIVVLQYDPFQDVGRESMMVEGWPIEAFIHNVQAQNYFFDRDRQNGIPVMLNLVAEGIEIPGPCDISRQQKAEAHRILEEGPPQLDEKEILSRRYQISDMLDDLRGVAKIEESYAILSKLYLDLGDFHLRAAGQWSGRGKGLVRAMRRYAPDSVKPYADAFQEAFQHKDFHNVIALAENILEPYGGILFDYSQKADPEGWRNFKLPQL